MEIKEKRPLERSELREKSCAEDSPSEIRAKKRKMITLEYIFNKMMEFDIPLGRAKKSLG